MLNGWSTKGVTCVTCRKSILADGFFGTKICTEWASSLTYQITGDKQASRQASKRVVGVLQTSPAVQP